MSSNYSLTFFQLRLLWHHFLRTIFVVIFPCVALAATNNAGQENIDFESMLSRARTGDVDACYKVAFKYLLKSNPNITEALLWGKIAAQAGHIYAQLLVGIISFNDSPQAILWTKFAADRGSAVAQYHLASMYIGKDNVLAAKYLILASKTHSDAAFRLRWRSIRLSPQGWAEAERLAKSWKPVCQEACVDRIVESCVLCPLTEEEALLTKQRNFGEFLFGGSSNTTIKPIRPPKCASDGTCQPMVFTPPTQSE